MPRHQHVTTCLKSHEPVSKFCSCAHCTLSVCSVCGAYEGGLTTDCPGTAVDYDKQQEVYETNLDFTDERGWHQGEPMKRRVPRFEETKLPPEPPRSDPRATIAPLINWAVVDRAEKLRQDLAQKAIAWVLADRAAEDHSALLTRLEDEVDASTHERAPAIAAEHGELLKKLDRKKTEFQLASQLAEKSGEEFRQAARLLVAALEWCA